MNLEEIEVIIEKDGRVRIEVRGVKGDACLDLTQALEEALGGEVESREMTPEAYEEARQQEQTRQQQRK
jgi:acylphosphatase